MWKTKFHGKEDPKIDEFVLNLVSECRVGKLSKKPVKSMFEFNSRVPPICTISRISYQALKYLEMLR